LNTQELKLLISKGETEKVEFKKCTTEVSASVFESICSFLNRNGGKIYIGVLDSGEIIGVKSQTIENIKNSIYNQLNNIQFFNPTVYLPIDTIEIDNKKVLEIVVPESSQVHRYKNKVFDRIGSVDNDVTYNYQLIDNLHARKRKESSENEVLPQINISDFDEKTFRMVRQILSIHNQVHPWLFMSDEDLLKSAGFWRKDALRNCEGYVLAAVLLFGKEQTILTCLPHYRTDAIYRNVEFRRFLKPLVSDPDIRYNDRELITENLILAYSRLMNFVQRNLPDKFSLDEKNINRIDLRNIIFREIIANLLIHREFSSSFEAKFLIFSDKIITENWNKPLQFGNITIENWTSHTKNPLIAKVFRELKWVEELGSGKKNILKYASLYFDNQTITIKDEDKFVFEIDFEEFTPQDTPQVTPQDNLLNGGMLNERLQKLAKVMNGEMTREELMNALQISDKKNFRENYLIPALQNSWIEMTLPTKPNSRNQKYRKIILGGNNQVILGGKNDITPQVTPQVTPQDNLQDEGLLYDRLQKLVKVMNGEMTREELMNALQISDKKNFRENYIIPALQNSWIEMTLPTKPSSRNQKYRKIILGGKNQFILGGKNQFILGGKNDTTPQDTPQDNLQDEGLLYDRLQKLVKVMNGEMTREELMNALYISDKKNFRENYLNPALKKRWIKMTMPTKPTSRNQKYLRIKKI